MLSRRIIPCLDVREGRVVKGVKFRDHVDMGDIADLALRYRDEGADELVFYDISASPEGRSVDYAWIERVSRLLDIPFCVAGGIRDVETARRVLYSGADKVSVNTPALERPELIGELAQAFGVQCVVVGVDSILEADGEWRVRRYTGDPSKMQGAGLRTLDWVMQAQRLGTRTACGGVTTWCSCARYAPSAKCRWSPRAARARWRISSTCSSRRMWMARWQPVSFTAGTSAFRH